jgi:serine/threonine protein kinase
VAGKFKITIKVTKKGAVKVAVKKLHNPNGMEEFFRESQILKSLRHPNIVSLFGVFTNPDKEFFIVTELMPLGNLKSLLMTLGPAMIQFEHLLRM